MSLENTIAKYEIQVARTGDGAAVAVDDFKKIDIAARDLDKSLATSTASLKAMFAQADADAGKAEKLAQAMKQQADAAALARGQMAQLGSTSMLTTSSLRALNDVSLLTGGTRLHELSYAGMAAAAGMRVLRSAAAATGMELATLGPILGGIAAVVGAGVYLWNNYQSELKKTEEQAKASGKALEGLPSLIGQITAAQNAGLISAEQSAKWASALGRGSSVGSPPSFATLGQVSFPTTRASGTFNPADAGIVTPSGVAQVQKEMQDAGLLTVNNVLNPQIAALEKLRELEKTAAIETLDGLQKESAQAKKNYDDRIQQIQALALVAGNKLSPGDQAGMEAGAGALYSKQLGALADKADAAEAAAAIKQVESEITLITATEGKNREGQAQHEFDKRLTLYIDLLTKGKIAEDQYSSLVLEAEAKRMEGIRAQDAAALTARHTETLALTKEFEQELQIAALESGKSRADVAKMEYEARLEFDAAMAMDYRITLDEMAQMDEAAYLKKLQMLQKTELKVKTLEQLENQAATDFAKGFANAFVDFASGSKSAEDAFKEFAVSFLKQIAAMIIQTEVLALVKAIAGLGGGGVVTSTGSSDPARAANGAVLYAAGGLSGVSSVSSPTYFPKFNVVAGEAGREMLTVLARPKFMNLGGIEAVVGNAGANKLAITNANDLMASAAGTGAGGHITIEIRHSEASEARIIDSSVKGAVVKVTQDMQTNSRLREAVKRVSPK